MVYTLRVNMSVAAPDMRDDLGWSEYEKGLALVNTFDHSFSFLLSPSSLPFTGAIQQVKFLHHG